MSANLTPDNYEIQAVPYVDPQTLLKLNWTTQALICENGKSYPVRDSIPVFVEGYQEIGQKQVSESFEYKWNRTGRLHDDGVFERVTKPLAMGFLGFKNEDDIKDLFSNKIILDAGVGCGLSARTYGHYAQQFYGIDISPFVAKNYLSHFTKLYLAQADIFSLPYPEESFDVIVSSGVLHHTPNTKDALKALIPKLKTNGIIIFYVYRKKAPVREFVDDFIRDKISNLPPDEAWKKLEPLTQLARQLTALKAKVVLQEDIDILEIPAGEYDVQRLLYWFFFKFYWNNNLDFDSNNHINFDWYQPKYAHRHTKAEVLMLSWLEETGLDLKRLRLSKSGISVIAQKA